MIVELGVGVLTVGAAGYTVYWYRRRKGELAKQDKMRKKQLKILKMIKRKFEEEK